MSVIAFSSISLQIPKGTSIVKNLSREFDGHAMLGQFIRSVVTRDIIVSPKTNDEDIISFRYPDWMSVIAVNVLEFITSKLSGVGTINKIKIFFFVSHYPTCLAANKKKPMLSTIKQVFDCEMMPRLKWNPFLSNYFFRFGSKKLSPNKKISEE